MVCMVSLPLAAQYNPAAFKAQARAQKMETLPLGSVTLQDPLFLAAKEKIRTNLKKWNADSLLFWHRRAAGLPDKVAGPYKGWESGGSNILGHYLTALSLMYASTGDKELQQRIQYIVSEMAACQQKAGDGTVFNGTGYAKAFNDMLAGKFEIRFGGPETAVINDGIYFYGMHKNLAGLRDAWLLAGEAGAKEVLLAYVDWIDRFVQALPVDRFQELLYVEHGGMAELIADCYAITGNPRYAHLAKQFVQHKLADPLAAGVDMLYPQHANSRIPQFVGYARMHTLLGDSADSEGRAAANFWDIVIHHHTLANGGNSEFERFGPAGRITRRIGMTSSETCNTYNMLKLSHELYQQQGNREYMDYYEGALYNHIRASLSEAGQFSYYVPTKPGWFKSFSTPFTSNWCCVGTGMESPGKYEQDIYAQDRVSLTVNLFIASTVNWKEKGLRLQMETRFPYSDTLRFRVLEARQKAGLRIRLPSWLAGEALCRINGKQTALTNDNGYAQVSAALKKGDRIEVVLPMGLRIEETPDNPDVAAIYFGPVLLAGELGRQGIENINQEAEDIFDFLRIPEYANLPVLLGSKTDPASWIRLKDRSTLRFTLQAKDGREFRLSPFYGITNQRYSMYWDLFTPKSWAARELYDNHLLQDKVICGDSASETAHGLTGHLDRNGKSFFQPFRTADSSGWFSYTLQKKTEEPLFLEVGFWGAGWGPEAKGRVDIYVENTKIATADLGNRLYETIFYELPYPIPPALIRGRSSLQVRFQVKNEKLGGGIYGCRLVRAEGLNHPKLLGDQF